MNILGGDDSTVITIIYVCNDLYLLPARLCFNSKKFQEQLQVWSVVAALSFSTGWWGLNSNVDYFVCLFVYISLRKEIHRVYKRLHICLYFSLLSSSDGSREISYKSIAFQTFSPVAIY